MRADKPEGRFLADELAGMILVNHHFDAAKAIADLDGYDGNPWQKIRSLLAEIGKAT